MGHIHIDLFTSLDGVAQAPGGPEEDMEGGFAYGGWQAPLFDDVVGEQVDAGMADLDALLLGRKTYDIFAGYWPHQEEGVAGEIARLFNGVPKYVASRSNPRLEWENSTLLGPGLSTAVNEVRDQHSSVHVIGSLDLVQSLFAGRLFDRLNLWVYPILLGGGKKVFSSPSVQANLRLTAPAETSPKGAVLLRYALAEGLPATGEF
jgi:dihydrofolate reductase